MHDSPAAGQRDATTIKGITSRWLSIGAAVVTLVVMTAALIKLDRTEQERHRTQLRAGTLEHLSALRARIEGALNARLYVTGGLVAYVSNHPDISAEEFRSLAEPLYAQLKGVQSIRLARDSVISHIYPAGGYEGDLGTRLLENPKLREPILRAIKNDKTVMAGPLQLKPGAPAFLISRTPIFVASKAAKQVWGLTCIFIYQDALFDEVGLKPATDNFIHALRGRDALGEKGEVFWGEPSVLSNDPVLLDIWLPEGSWQIAAIPAGGWNSLAPGTVWLRSAGGTLAILAAVLIWLLVRTPARLRILVEDATSALRTSETWHRELMERASVGIVLSDLQGNCIFTNSEICRMTGSTPAKLRLTNIRDVIAAADEQTGPGYGLESLADGRTMEAEAHLRRNDGKLLPVEIIARRMHGDNIQWIIRDVFGRKQLEALREKQRHELEHASRLSLIGEMASGLAHELGQPLSAAQNYVGGCISRIEDDISDTGALLAVLQQANAQIARAGSIIQHVKDFTRKREPLPVPLDINKTVREVMTLLAQEIFKSGSHIRMHLGEDLPMALADKIEVEQVVLNLVKNGLEAMEDGPAAVKELVVRTMRGEQGTVAVTIEDAGSGIPEEHFATLFEPFFSSKTDGTGLGLSISKGIVEGCGGKIGARNNPDGGASFFFDLPCVNHVTA